MGQKFITILYFPITNKEQGLPSWWEYVNFQCQKTHRYHLNVLRSEQQDTFGTEMSIDKVVFIRTYMNGNGLPRWIYRSAFHWLDMNNLCPWASIRAFGLNTFEICYEGINHHLEVSNSWSQTAKRTLASFAAVFSLRTAAKEAKRTPVLQNTKYFA